MNLAIDDVVVLARALCASYLNAHDGLLGRYSDDVLPRIWKAQLGELRAVTDSDAGRRYLAEGYTGWSLPPRGF
jgi:p-hydroxybenzoate 3-monooxygenase